MLDAIINAPVLVKVLGALGLILVVSRFVPLLPSIVVGALVLAVWSGHTPWAMLRIAGDRFWSVDNFCLLLIVFQVIWLSSQMAATGVMGDLVESVRSRVSQRGSMAVLPAVIGLLPMPGGALFSAPLVDRCDVNDEFSPALKAQTNHWFRHIWEYWWPLYPGVLVALDETRLEVWQFMLLQIPLTLCAVGSGYLFLLRRIRPTADDADGDGSGETPGFLRLVLPIAVVVAGYALVKLAHRAVSAVYPDAPDLNRYLPMIVGIFAAMLVLQIQRPLGREAWKTVIFSRRVLSMAAVVAAVRIYGAFIEADLPEGVSVAQQMSVEMDQWGVSTMLIFMLLPFVSGLATGLSVGFVGVSFPIVMGLLGRDPSLSQVLPTVVLSYGFGYMGMLISPVHVCLVVTSEHFETRLLGNVAGLAKPAVLMLLASLGLHYAVALLFG